MPPSHEDTVIAKQRTEPLDLLFQELEEAPHYADGTIARCRALFRYFGERMTSFDLNRQIYG